MTKEIKMFNDPLEVHIKDNQKIKKRKRHQLQKQKLRRIKYHFVSAIFIFCLFFCRKF